MAKGKRKGKKSVRPVEPTFGKDDERAYRKEPVPDPDSDEYYNDEVDRFHADREKILLDGGKDIEAADSSSGGEDEVLAFDDDSDDEDGDYQEMKKRLDQMKRRSFVEELESDLDDEDQEGGAGTEDGTSNSWGPNKLQYYGGLDSDIDEDLSDSEPEAADLEEQEARAIQKRLLQALDDDDIGLDSFKTTEVLEVAPSGENVTQDLTKLSKQEKLQALKKQSPELLDLIEDYKLRSEELQQRLMPVFKLIREKKLSSSSSGAKLISTKTRLYLNYLVNVSFYFMLKAKQSPVESHPVIKRLLQYRNLMKQLDSVEPRLQKEMNDVLTKVNHGHQFKVIVDEEEIDEKTKFKSVLLTKKKQNTTSRPRKRLSEMMDNDDSLDNTDVNVAGKTHVSKKSRQVTEDLQDEVDEQLSEDRLAEVEEDKGEDVEDERRGINYQIEKNKGLTTRKKKALRNPRVKLRNKYRKAKIGRKGQVQEVRTEMTKYGGEYSGIRKGVKRSTKFN